MKYKRVFISLPMKGKSDEDIQQDLMKAKKVYEAANLNGDSVQFCHNHDPQIRALYCGAKEEYEGVWYLGKAFQAMSKCDEVFFYGDWESAKGCVFEHAVCVEYGIPFTTEKLLKE